ncbi:MAG: hypothetical protein K1X51_11620 [Rhodospirillaceae bacterium]|nr:hypothetical protein [Rhodospirillaceae bacterium]
MSGVTKRQFLAGAAGLGAALQSGVIGAARAAEAPAKVPSRKVKTTKLFKAPEGFPNCIAVAPEGLWIAEQKPSGANAAFYHAPEPKELTEKVWLVDWTGKVLKTVTTQCRNTSGMAFGGGYIWSCANEAPNGVWQTDLNSKLISHRQIPLGPAKDGGGCHGAMYQDGKLYLACLRLRGILRVDPVSWTPEFLIPYSTPRAHGIAWDSNGGSGGAIWLITGTDSTGYANGQAGLAKYDAATGALLETAEFVPGSCDPHGLAMHDGALISCDAGVHPNWPLNDSPHQGWIFKIEFV